MIKQAKSAGANCVKFQKSNLEEKFTKSALSRTYSSQNSFGPTYGDHKRVLEFSDDQYKELMKVRYCNNFFNLYCMLLRRLSFQCAVYTVQL